MIHHMIHDSVCILIGRHSNATYCNDNNAFVGVPISNGCDGADSQCTWLPCELH